MRSLRSPDGRTGRPLPSALMGIALGIVVTSLLTILVAATTRRSSNLALRIVVTLLTAFITAYVAYWAPFWAVPSDQASSWEWLVVGGYFLVAATTGAFVLLITQVAKKVHAKDNTH